MIVPDVFEMKKKKGVWTYVPYIATLHMDGVDWAFNTSASVGGSPFVFIDECEPFDYDRIEATLQGRAFAGSTEAARTSRVPKYAPTDSRSIRRRGFLHDALESNRGTLRAALDEAIRKAML